MKLEIFKEQYGFAYFVVRKDMVKFNFVDKDNDDFYYSPRYQKDRKVN